MKVKLHYAKRKPEDIEALQSALLADLGLGTTYDIGPNEFGLTVRFKDLDDGTLSAHADAPATPFEKELVQIVARIAKTANVTVIEGSTKVAQQGDDKKVALMIFVRPAGSSDAYNSKLTGSLVRNVAKGKLVVMNKIATEVCVRVPKKAPREIDRKIGRAHV